MPKTLTTNYLLLAAGVYVARKGDAVHVIITDGAEPDLGSVEQPDGLGGGNSILSKANWISEQEISVEQFNDVIATLSPDWKGQLVNVAPEGVEPFLLPQQQAPKHAQLVEALVSAEVTAALDAKAAEVAEAQPAVKP
jgi:hypothetical protein